MEKAEEQERLLDESAKQLEAQRAKGEELRKALEEKEVGLLKLCAGNLGGSVVKFFVSFDSKSVWTLRSDTPASKMRLLAKQRS